MAMQGNVFRKSAIGAGILAIGAMALLSGCSDEGKKDEAPAPATSSTSSAPSTSAAASDSGGSGHHH